MPNNNVTNKNNRDKRYQTRRNRKIEIQEKQDITNTSPACAPDQWGTNSWLGISNSGSQHAMFVKLTPNSYRLQCTT